MISREARFAELQRRARGRTAPAMRSAGRNGQNRWLSGDEHKEGQGYGTEDKGALRNRALTVGIGTTVQAKNDQPSVDHKTLSDLHKANRDGGKIRRGKKGGQKRSGGGKKPTAPA